MKSWHRHEGSPFVCREPLCRRCINTLIAMNVPEETAEAAVVNNASQPCRHATGGRNGALEGIVARRRFNPQDCEHHTAGTRHQSMLLARVVFRPPNDRSYIQLRCAACIYLMFEAGWAPRIVEVL